MNDIDIGFKKKNRQQHGANSDKMNNLIRWLKNLANADGARHIEVPLTTNNSMYFPVSVEMYQLFVHFIIY